MAKAENFGAVSFGKFGGMRSRCSIWSLLVALSGAPCFSGSFLFAPWPLGCGSHHFCRGVVILATLIALKTVKMSSANCPRIVSDVFDLLQSRSVREKSFH
eukprot:3059953-Amphidinium_carterae.1